MNKEELRALVARMLEEMEAPAEPPVKAAEYHGQAQQAAQTVLSDFGKTDLRREYLVEGAQNPEKFLALKAKTPARLGVGRTGTRYLTSTMLRFRADHAAAQDSVFAAVPEEFAKANDLIPLCSCCKDKEQYLTRPDLGRVFDEQNQKVIEELLRGSQVILAVGDGLSSNAVTANAPDCLAAIRQGLRSYGIPFGKGLFIRHCRVGASDHMGDLTGCEVVCLLVGERPGLATDRSMSAYLTYKPHRGISESRRTVISNIHDQGISPVEAGAHIASLIRSMLQQKASGIDLKQEQRP